LKVKGVPSQTGPAGKIEIVASGTKTGSTCITIAFEFAVAGTAQLLEEVIRTRTISLSASVAEENTEELFPVTTPFTSHS